MFDEYAFLKELSSFERLAVGEGEKRACGQITAQLRNWGLEPEFHEFSMSASQTGEAFAEIGGETWPLHPMGNVDACEIKGKFLLIENLDLLYYNPGMADHCIVMYSELTLPLFDIYQKNKLAALIRIGQPFKSAPALIAAQDNFEGIDYQPHKATVSYETACRMKAYSGETMTLTIRQKQFQGTATNIVVRIAGTEPDGNDVYAVAHYDCTPGNFGASDNGGGTANLMKVIDYFVKQPPKRNLICIFFSGEESGLCGSKAYVKDMTQEEKQRAALVVNIDMAGDAIGSSVFVVTGSIELKGYVGAVAREDGLLFKERLDIYSSDSMPFVYEEIPAVNVTRWGGPAVGSAHSVKDTFEHIDRDGLALTSDAAISVLKRVLNAKIFPIRREIDSNLRSKIEHYQYLSTKKAPELNWRPEYEK